VLVTGGSPNVLTVIKESVFRRLGKPTLIGYAVLAVVATLGVLASAAWTFVRGH
jgi:hypothetical protein